MKLRTALLLTLTGLLAGGALLAQSGITPAKEADIRRLIEMTGGNDMGKQMAQSIMEQIQPALEGMLPAGARREEILKAFRIEFEMRFDPGELTGLMIPIYDKHMNHEEIRELLAFYQTPLGQRVLKALPAIMLESQAAGSQWGERIFQDVIRQMEEEFPELKESFGQ